MLYISIDNDQHTYLALSIIKRLNKDKSDITFLSHNSPRNRILDNSDYLKIGLHGHPLSDGSGFKKISTYIKSYKHHQNLKEVLSFNSHDTFIALTEYQINNAVISKMMKKAGGKVFVLDEGVGFYFNNSTFHKSKLNLKNLLMLAAYNLGLRLANVPAVAKKGLESRMYIAIKDNLVDAIYSSMKIKIDRKCKVIGYKHFLIESDSLEKKDINTALFFANNLESFNLKKEEMELSEKIIGHMCKNFSKVFVKIHPMDWTSKSDLFYFYSDIVSKLPNAELVDNSVVGNEAIRRIKPNLVVGSMGAAVFDAFFFQCQPIFFYQLMKHVQDFDICSYVLKNLNYNFIKDIEDITPQYNSNVKLDDISYSAEHFNF